MWKGNHICKQIMESRSGWFKWMLFIEWHDPRTVPFTEHHVPLRCCTEGCDFFGNHQDGGTGKQTQLGKTKKMPALPRFLRTSKRCCVTANLITGGGLGGLPVDFPDCPYSRSPFKYLVSRCPPIVLFSEPTAGNEMLIGDSRIHLPMIMCYFNRRMTIISCNATC